MQDAVAVAEFFARQHSAVTRSGETWVIFMPMKSAKGGCRLARYIMDIFVIHVLRLPDLAVPRKPSGGELEVVFRQAVAGLQHFERRVAPASPSSAASRPACCGGTAGRAGP